MLNLVGKVTPEGWLIQSAVSFAPDHTGGYFSNCYFVERGDERAFLKALDIEKFDITQLLDVLAGFQYESDLCKYCADSRLTRVVRVLEQGKLENDATASPVLRNVPFLIFELADDDIRSSVDVSQTTSVQWRFWVLHQTSLALLQLHQKQIAHQDLKPSNVLRFAEEKIKLADLGRSSRRGSPAPHDAFDQPGARNYAPFEQGYGSLSTDWVERRVAADVFHLGCLTVFVFTNICFPEFVRTKLPEAYKAENWGGTYSDVIPHLELACIQALSEIANDFPEPFRVELTTVVLDLCHPDPLLRARTGPKNKTQVGTLWLQRYVAKFDRLEKAARIKRAVIDA